MGSYRIYNFNQEVTANLHGNFTLEELQIIVNEMMVLSESQNKNNKKINSDYDYKYSFNQEG